jgi:glucosamine--fructose-6-phosphate aminotransferase (isomerizing)
LLALTMAKLRNRLTTEEEAFWPRGLRHLPAALGAACAGTAGQGPSALRASSTRSSRPRAALPDRAQGALKLKDLVRGKRSGGRAGHGPLALVDASMPVVAIAPNDALLESRPAGSRARGGEPTLSPISTVI